MTCPLRASSAITDQVAKAGYHGVRVWSTLGCEGGPCAGESAYWHGREVGPRMTPGYWEHVEQFFGDLNSRRLRLVWSHGDIRALQPRHESMARFAQLDNAVGGIIDWIDCGNEAYETGEPDPRRLAECVRAYQAAGGRALKTLTDAPVHRSAKRTVSFDDYSLPPADAFDVHSYRGGHSWEKRYHAWNYTYQNPPRLAFGLSSEPPGSGERVSVVENKHELDDEAVALLGLASILGRQAHVWFSGEGVILDRGLAIEAGFQLGRRRSTIVDAEKESPVGAMVGASLGLLAFLLAFTFGFAASRFETRRTILLDEVNAIGTAYLRTATLPDPTRTDSRRLWREYAEARRTLLAAA